MDIKLTQRQKIRPDLQLTPQMQQFVKLIQMPIIELKSYLEQELEQNPLLEEVPTEEIEQQELDENTDPDEALIDALFSSINEEYQITYPQEEQKEIPLKAKQSWREHLLKEVRNHTIPEHYPVLEFIIFNLTQDGFLKISLEEIASQTKTDINTVNAIIHLIQNIGPAGICARDVKECLLIQIKREEGEQSPTYKVVNEAFFDLIKRRYRKIARELKIPLKQVYWVANHLNRYQSRPLIEKEEPISVIPEFEIKIIDGQIVIERLSNRFLPKIKINQEYVQSLKKAHDLKAKEFLRTYLQRAKNLINAVQEREENLYQLVEFLAQHQREFVESGPAHLKPLTMKKAAKYIGVSESTISRLANQKYIQLPWGCVQLKQFFLNPLSYTNDLPRQAILEEIKEILSANPKLSDAKIREKLLDRGIQISRRTVNKYRHLLNTR